MRRIAVFTGNRAEYGLQYPLLCAIRDHPGLEYSLIISGAHLDTHFGRTREEIESDGFQVSAEVSINLPEDSLYATAHAIGTGTIGVANALQEIQPDILLVYADRFEGFAAVIAGSQMGLPTAHVEGGDLTEGGALDDSVRHAMTKLSHLHFTTNQQASNRILGMGEEAWRIHTIGFPAIDLIAAGEFATADEVHEKLGVDLARPVVVFTQHSVATEYEAAADQVAPGLETMRRLADEGCQIIVTYPNNDAGGKRIIEAVKTLYLDRVPGIMIHKSLGRRMYHGILGLALNPARRIACVGNSSSGIKETPAFYCPAVDIGDRQAGRLRAENVLQADYSVDSIYAATRKALFDDDFRSAIRNLENPYGTGDSGSKLTKVLSEVILDTRLIQKRMTLRGEAKGGWYR